MGLALAAGFDDPSDLGAAVSPAAVLRRDRASWTALGTGLAAGMGVIFGVGVLGGAGLAASTAGSLAAALVVCVAVWLSAGLGIASVRFAASCTWLAGRRRIPLHLMAFLADAHRRGVLRQVGAVYQYRHAGFQQHLARRR